MNQILETERLYLRELQETDFSAISAILQNEAVMYAWEHAFSTEEVKAWIAENIMRYKRDGFSYWAVIIKASNELIGVAGILLEKVDNENHIGIGYIFNNTYWGRGYALEAAFACVDYAFNTLGFNIITAQIRPTNAASIRVAEKLSMTVMRSFIRKYRGKNIPHLLYGRSRAANSDDYVDAPKST